MGWMPRPTAPKYRTTNWPAYNAALKRRGSLDVWFDPEMDWFAVPAGRPGRSLRFSDRAIEFCLTLKGLFQLPLRQGPLAAAQRRIIRRRPVQPRHPEQAYALIRQQELEGFIEGLFNGEDHIDLPERAHQALGHLGELRAMMAGICDLVARDIEAESKTSLETTLSMCGS